MKLKTFDKNNKNKKKFYIIFSLVVALVITIVSLFTMSIYEVQTTNVSVVNATVKFNNATLQKFTSASDSSFFKNSTYREKIKTLTFEDEVNIPVGATQWDIGVDQEMIFAYVVPIEEGSTYYDLHIQSDMPINANEDMSYWFNGLSYLDSIEGLELVNFSNTKNMQSMFGSNISYYSDNSSFDSYNRASGYYSNIFEVDISSIDTSNVTNMIELFANLGINNPNFTLEVSNFDTSNVTSMKGMFMNTGHESIELNLNVSNFDTSKVTDMSYMFYYSNNYPLYLPKSTTFTLDVSHFDTSKVTNMAYMFYGVGYGSEVFTLDVNNFDTSNVINMRSMFAYIGGDNRDTLNLDLSNFDTSKVTNMAYMFRQSGPNGALDSLGTNTNLNFPENVFVDISSFDTSKVTNMAGMFAGLGCESNIFTLDVSNFDTSNVTNMQGMFDDTGKNNLNFTLDVSNFDTSKVKNMSYMFSSTGYNSTVFTLDVSNFDTSNVTNMSYMFEDFNSNFTLDITNFDTSSVINMSYMFSFFKINSDVATINLSNFDTSKVTNMEGMFRCFGYYSDNVLLDVSHFNTSNVTNMSRMFEGTGYSDSNFTLNVSDFDTSNVTNMSYIFCETGFHNSYFTLDISNFDTSNVTNMSYMFAGFYSGSYTTREYLKIKFGNNFDTSNVTNMSSMFYRIDNLELENYNGFDTSNVSIYGGSYIDYGMFSYCKKVNMEIDILKPSISASNYRNMFYNAATTSGSEIKVNYTAENQSLVQAMVNTKVPSSNNNVHIGDLLTEHTITINDANVTSDLTSALKTKKITLSTSLENKIIKSFKLNGNTLSGRTFMMPNENVVITDIEYYEIIVPNIITTNATNETKIGDEIKLISTIEGKGVKSFKLNGILINGRTFTMTDEDVEITDVILIDQVTIESEHNPYPTSMNNRVYYENTFEGATSLTIELTYQTDSTNYDWIYLYDTKGSTIPYGGIGNKYGGNTKTTTKINLSGNYIKIVFRTDDIGNQYYGFEAVITPNYD